MPECPFPNVTEFFYLEKLKQDKAPAPAPDDADGPGGVAKSARLAQRSRPVAMDDIDGRGTFQAKELEAELREMHRSTLQDQLGTTFSARYSSCYRRC